MESTKFRRIDCVRGLILYRFHGTPHPEFLLLKKVHENDWSPPKGRREGNTESEIETAVRETQEETNLIEEDYQLLNSPRIYFEYKTAKNVMKKVTLWPAQLKSPCKGIRLSDEHEKYSWLGIEDAARDIKTEYRGALLRANAVVVDHENLMLTVVQLEKRQKSETRF